MADTVMPEPVETSLHTLRKDRDRRAIRTGTVGIASQILSHGIRLVVIPLSIALLGVEQYGLWMAVGSVIAWGGVADLGLAPGLINTVATARARGDHAEMRRALSTAFAAYGAIAATIAALAVAVSTWDGLPGAIGARTPELAASARSLILVCGMMFAVSTLTRVVCTTTEALQEGYWVPLTYVAGGAAGLLMLIWIAWAGGCGVVQYALAVSLPTPVAQVILAAYVFGWRYRELAPGPEWVSAKSLATLWRFAGPLMAYQVANLAILYSANILIANRLGAGAVAGYSVPYAAFAALISAAWMVASAYMPAYTDAAARGDWTWVRRRIRALVIACSSSTLMGGLALLAIGPQAIAWWTRGTIRPDRCLLASLLLFAVTRVISNTNSAYLIGVGRVRIVAASHVAAALTFILGSFWLLPELGLPAVALILAAGHTWTAGLALLNHDHRNA